MFNSMKLFYLNNRSIIRIVRYSLISLFLLIVTWIVDYRYPGMKAQLPDIVLMSTEVTSSFLSTLSGTFLTVSTFTFTTILTVLNQYSNSFTPRIVQDFIDKPNVLSLFGVFIGGFFYTVLALFMVQNVAPDALMISGTIAVFYAIAAMISFVLFVRRVLEDIKVSEVIEQVYQNAFTLIKAEAAMRKHSERFAKENYRDEIKVYANRSGYLYEINSRGILNQLDGMKAELVVEKKIGAFVSKGMYIGVLHTLDPLELEGPEKEEFLSKLSSFLVINSSQNDQKDYHYAMKNLVEIAMMALSPGVNDPTTAIEAIGKISSLLGNLFSTNNFYVVLSESDTAKVVYNGYSVTEELYHSYSQLIHYGKSDPMVAKAILEGLYMVYMITAPSVQDQVVEYIDYVYQSCLEAMETTVDQGQLTRDYVDFQTNKDRKADAEAVRAE